MNNIEIIYLSRACSNEILDSLPLKYSVAAVRFNYSFIEGIAKNNKVHSLYVYNNNLKKEEVIINGNINQYVFYSKNIFLRIIYIIKKSIKLYKNKNTILIADALNYSDALISCIIAQLFKRPTIAIITDLPEFIGTYIPKNERSLSYRTTLKIKYFILNRFEKYILLTEDMKDELKIKSKNDYYVMEGVANIAAFNKFQNIEKVNQIMYAGSLHKEYGITNFIQAFIKYTKENNSIKLVIYGDGDSKQEILELCKENKQIEYKGIAKNEEILLEECKSLLLVNPRPIYDGKEENKFEKYSFPSKTMEYMSSGTPLLTTKLSGMPNEYLDYLFLIPDNSIESIYYSLKSVLSLDLSTLSNKGLLAREFMRNNKTGDIQFKKIYKKLLGEKDEII